RGLDTRQPIFTSAPPSTGSATPVMKLASSEARNRAALATSHAVPILPLGCPCSKMYSGPGIGRWMIAAENYSCADQYIGTSGICDSCKMNGTSGDHGIETH